MDNSKINSPVHSRLKLIKTNGQNCVEPPSPDGPKARLHDQFRQAIRSRHYSIKTEEAYWGWIRRFIIYHNKRHPIEMGEMEIGQFLSSLARDSHVSASTQNQALNVILFLYREVLARDIRYINGVIRAKKPRRLPVVLTREEIKGLLSRMDGTIWLMTTLLYGAGLRLMECLRFRVKDIDLPNNQIVVRGGKGDKDRHTMLPTSLKRSLGNHLEVVKYQHQRDLERGLDALCCPML